MPSSNPIDRRRFLTRALRKPVVRSLSCERLYVRYLEALNDDRVAQFVAHVEAQCVGADEIELTDREWLDARDDFRQTLDVALRPHTRRP
jgi:hypothetical protein